MNFIRVFLILIFLTGCVSEIRESESTLIKTLKGINGEPVVPRDANRIYLHPIINNPQWIGLSERLIIKIRESLNMDGRLVINQNEKNSDLRLDISIVRYFVQNIQYGEMRRPVKKRLRIVLSVRLFDLNRGKMIFYESGIQAFKIYSDIIPPIVTKSQVLEQVIEELSGRITSKTITGWYTDRMTLIERGK